MSVTLSRAVGSREFYKLSYKSVLVCARGSMCQRAWWFTLCLRFNLPAPTPTGTASYGACPGTALGSSHTWQQSPSHTAAAAACAVP